MEVSTLEVLMIIISSILALWGLFHQFIVGATVTLFLKEKELQLRLVLLGWVAYGAFISFVGLLSAVILFMGGLNSRETRIVLFMSVGAMTLFSGHTLVSGLKIFPRPIKISFAIETLYILTCTASLMIFWLKEG